MAHEASREIPTKLSSSAKRLERGAAAESNWKTMIVRLCDDDEEVAEIVNGPVVRCAGCQQSAPPTATAFTLISSAHRWRVIRIADGSGRAGVEWRCPRCWAAYKARVTYAQSRR